MATIPDQFTVDPESAIASFDFEDIVTGLGFVTFLGTASEDDSAIDFHLITESLFSSVSGTRSNSAGTTTLDFDTSIFNLPRTAKGTAFFSAGIGVNSTDTIKLLVQLKHVDSGANVINITSEITTKTHQGTSGNTSTMVFINLPITEKHFKKGDFLRLEVKMIKVSGSLRIEIGHDPKNQDGTSLRPSVSGTTVMSLLMPFKVDI